jgi:hypothetical protein
METIAQPRQFVDDPRYKRDRQVMLAGFVLENIDAPIREIVAGFAGLPSRERRQRQVSEIEAWERPSGWSTLGSSLTSRSIATEP